MKEDFALELYKLYRGEQHNNFEHHRETIQNYLAFAVAVLGATVVGVLQIKDVGWVGIAVLVGPILNVSVCVLAIGMCDRSFLGVLERIAITAKLEAALGLRDRVDLTGEGQDDVVVFPADKYLLPERWIKGTQHATTEEFIQQHMNTGMNRLAKRTFYSLIAVNVLLGVAIVLTLFSEIR